LQEQDNQSARERFRADPGLIELDRVLADLGYSWDLETISPQRNEYDIRLTKQGSSFLVTAASSGERELLTYLFAIYALNIRDALIIVDEPELHLHPKWQSILLDMFIRLSRETGNQFLMATHSPTFVSPESIQYVSRVYSQNQKSQIVRLQPASLPDARRLFNCVNSQNNERVFFADAVVLVEGLSDRMIFEELFRLRAKKAAIQGVIEVVSVGGKGLFQAYEQLLQASEVQHFVVADLDYVEQVAPAGIKDLFQLDASELSDDVLQNVKSLDGEAIVAAVDHAIDTGDWSDARDIWAYVKSRRHKLISNLTEDQTRDLNRYLAECAGRDLFILSKGAIEAYLPTGYKGKRIDRLIEFINLPDFLERLPSEAKELHKIVETIIDRVEQQTIATAKDVTPESAEEAVA
jgi:energy-coupling factor transporter ATP-binding protein EcfA2